MSDTPSETALTLDLGQNGTYTFSSLTELADWIAREKAVYSPLLGWSPRDQVGRAASGYAKKAFQEVSAALQQAQAQAATVAFPQVASDVGAAIAKLYIAGHLPTATSPRGQVLVRLSEANQPEHMAFAVSYFAGLPILIQPVANQHLTFRGIQGMFQAALADLGIEADAETATAIKGLYAQWSATLDASKQAALHQKTAHDNQLSQQRDAGETQQRDHAAVLQTATSQLQAHVADAESRLAARLKDADERLSAVERTYDEKLALQAAVKYWEAKAKGHRCWAIVWAVAAAFTAATATWFTNTHLQATLGETRVMDAQLWQISKLAILAIFGVWLMRIVVRLMLSHTHLLTDATERRTMMLTYLAMMRRGQLPEGQSRELILQALFRPSSTGIVKDDASPPFMAEWLRATVGKD